MAHYMYVPYFSTNKADKHNFVIKQVNNSNLQEERVTRLELPDTYVLKNSASNGEGYFLCFYDEIKKEDVFITVFNGNIVKKKSSKNSGNIYIPIGAMGSQNFVIVTINSKGNYNIEMLDMEQETKWKKTFSAPSGTSWDIVSVKAKMEGPEIIRKENKSDGKYAFTIHKIQTDNGNEIVQNTIGTDELSAYPTFFSEKDGMGFTGGFYYKNGVYANQPDGVFFAMMMPDGSLNQVVTVPYSQVVEDIKSSLGEKYASGNTAIIFSGGIMAHETQSYIMTGQVITKENKDVGCSIQTGDFVTVKFSFNQKYKGATVVKIPEQTISLTGDVSKTNIVDLGVWLKNASLLNFRYFLSTPGNPIIGYTTKQKDDMVSLCFKNVGLKSDTTQPVCLPVKRLPETTATYKFSGITVPLYPIANHSIFTHPHEFMNVSVYELDKNTLFVRKMPLPPLEKIQIRVEPEKPELHEPQLEENKQQEGNSQKG